MIALDLGPKFSPGQIVITANAQAQLPMPEVEAALRRHLRGDWGDLGTEDVQENERSLKDGCRLLSAYCTSNRQPSLSERSFSCTSKGTKFWIITEADRSVTTILLPEDY